MIKATKWILTILFLMLIGGVGVLVFSAQSVRDWIAAIGYEPSESMSNLISDIDLTSKGLGILNASRPEIVNQDVFNAKCRNNDFTENSDVSVLGCHTSGKIYIYNITSRELQGITQSTLAHELLHAVWNRLTDYEVSFLTEELLDFYDSHYEDYADELSIYNEADLVEELHSRVGTEEKSLPDSLESYYAKYFVDQDSIVSYYNNYKNTFKTLKTELDQLKSDLDALDVKISTLKAEYSTRYDVLSKNVSEFNSCAKTAGCFSSTTSFNSERQKLVAEQTELNNIYNEINYSVNLYNEKAIKYNNNILHAEDLESEINSFSAPASI